MKKWIILAIAFIVFLLVLLFVLIPSDFTYSESKAVNTTVSETNRLLLNINTWREAIASVNEGNKLGATTDSAFMYDGMNFYLVKRAYGEYVFEAQKNGKVAPVFLQVLPKDKTSIWLLARFNYNTGSNPVKRVREYLYAREVADNLEEIAAGVRNYLSKREELYTQQITHAKVVDTTFLSTRFISSTYPSTQDIYSRVDSLRAYILSKNVKITGDPMLHVLQLDSNRFENMIALPMSNDIIPENHFKLKKMVLGNILIYEFRGGPHTTRSAFRQMQEYVSDHQLISPAIPYISFVTDRMKEADTSKWITRIYYPIF